MNTANTTGKSIWIDTTMHRCTAMEEDVRYPIEDYRQGRDSKTPVPPVSMYAGKPGDFDSADDLLRDTAWKVLAVLLTCGWILAAIYWAPKLLDMLVGLVPEAQ
jgi:hypothetical protein